MSLQAITLDDNLEAFLNNHQTILSSTGYCFAKYYGFELAIDAINTINSESNGVIGLVILGGNKTSDDYKKLLQKYGEDKLVHVFFAGDIPHKQVLSIISRSTIFLRPTYHDGDSNSVREAIAIGIPVVASDTELRPKETFLFTIGDSRAFVNQIYKILKSSSRQPQTINRVVDTTNLEAVANVYRSIVGSD